MLNPNSLNVVDLGEPARTHAQALYRRLHKAGEVPATANEAVNAALEYLALRVDDLTIEPGDVARSRGVDKLALLKVLPPLRASTNYRGYVGEWIRQGRPVIEEPPSVVAPVPESEAMPLQQPAPPISRPPRTPRELEPAHLPVGSDHPRRWKGLIDLHRWQENASGAWQDAHRRGIIQVVTGAGKTVFALYQLALLLDERERLQEETYTVIIVPRVALLEQWEENIRKHLDVSGLAIGQYHSKHRCYPASQDILLITAQSARGLLPDMSLDRDTLLIADECHTLGAPVTSRVFEADFTWTLGLSATPERGGDLGFEEILVPNLGSIVYRYGFAEAIRDRIISEFEVLRVALKLSEDERKDYDQRSESIKKLLNGLKATYPALRRDDGRFHQMLGWLGQQHPGDDRFEKLTAALSARRAIIHFAASKFDAVAHIARAMPNHRKVLCFHERIEAADRLAKVIQAEGHDLGVYHTGIEPDIRTENLARFAADELQWLVACRSLDEGIDIPAVDTVVIAAGTKSPRQTIQRLGRALRRVPGGRRAMVIILEIPEVEGGAIDQDALTDLREAASQISISPLADLLRILKEPPQTEKPVADKLSVGKRLVRKAKEIFTGWKEPTPTTHRYSQPRSSSFTGTPGMKSYYDKDSSPD